MIRILEDRVVDQIAAGEVVERPASVVKELVENALDAAAGQVEVSLKDGGRQLIEVVDDGRGMSEQDALLCIERHATSKIRELMDLQRVGTFGFRGEALPSIAAVSRFELLTRRVDDQDAVRVRLEGGKLNDVRPAASAPGTVVRVRNLFFNVPARRAFLRSVATELGHCTQTVVRVALARPDVGFTLHHGGRRIVDAPVADDLGRRAIDALGADAAQLVPVHATGGSYTLSGLAARPGVHRSTGNGAVYTYVNGRWVRDLVLRRAVQQAYRELVPRGRYPLVVLSLQLPGDGVDVNVHPAKAEVRFRDPAAVGAFVARALRNAVLESTGQPEPRVHRRSPAAALPALPFDGATPAPELPKPGVAPISSPLPDPKMRRDPPEVLPHSPTTRPKDGAAPWLVADAQPTADLRWFGVLAHRWFVGQRGTELVLVDGGRMRRRVQALRAEAPGRRLLVPAVMRWTEREVAATEALADALSEMGLDIARFSPTEVAVRAIPPSLAGADPEALVRIATDALSRGADVREAWAKRLPPAEVEDDVLTLRTVLAEAREAGVPIAEAAFDPEQLVAGRWS